MLNWSLIIDMNCKDCHYSLLVDDFSQYYIGNKAIKIGTMAKFVIISVFNPLQDDCRTYTERLDFYLSKLCSHITTHDEKAIRDSKQVNIILSNLWIVSQRPTSSLDHQSM